MHSAPAVNYPVGRSRFQGWLLLVACLTGIVLGLLWHEQTDLTGWRQEVFAVSWLASCLLASQAWLRTPPGRLRWDGQAWSWSCAQMSSSGHLGVHLDLQFVLLLSLRTETGTRHWLWPERKKDQPRWSALRRAVFSRRANRSSSEASGEAPAGQSR